MAQVTASTQLHTNADTLWREIGSFQSVGNWHPMLARVKGNGELPGAMRVAEAADGSRQIERLQLIDRKNHFYRYEVLSSPMPIDHYVGEFRVLDGDGGFSTVSWKSEFEVTSADEGRVVEAVRQFFDAGLENLRQKYH